MDTEFDTQRDEAIEKAFKLLDKANVTPEEFEKYIAMRDAFSELMTVMNTEWMIGMYRQHLIIKLKSKNKSK